MKNKLTYEEQISYLKNKLLLLSKTTDRHKPVTKPRSLFSFNKDLDTGFNYVSESQKLRRRLIKLSCK